MLNQGTAGAGVETRLRTQRILWGVFLVNVGLLALVATTGRDHDEAAAAGGNSPILYALLAVGLSAVAASFVVRRVFFRRAERERRVDAVQTGLIAAFCLCESAALLGVVALFTLPGRGAYALFVLAALGQALHFPRRAPLLAATPAAGAGGMTSSLR